MHLKDQTIVISGGATGIGFAIAKACIKEGASIVIAARTQSRIDDAVSSLREGAETRVIGHACDVRSNSDCESLFDATTEKLGNIDGVVCAAGIIGEIGRFEELDLEKWRNVVDTNLFGTVNLAQSAIRRMLPNQKGKLVFFSGGGQGPQPRRSAYTASKGAVWRLTETLGHEFGPQGIFINAVAPGAVNTNFLEEKLAAGPERVGAEAYSDLLKQKESGGTSPDFAAQLTTWLLSDRSNGLYGKVLSAKWDPYLDFSSEKLSHMSKSEIYTMKRVVSEDGRTTWN